MNEFQDVSMEGMDQVEGGGIEFLFDVISAVGKGIVKLIEFEAGKLKQQQMLQQVLNLVTH